jgi:hypothetical protein
MIYCRVSITKGYSRGRNSILVLVCVLSTDGVMVCL